MSAAINSASAPVITHFRGFDPTSRTLGRPRFCTGVCLGPAFPEGRTMLWADPAVAPHTGDIALIEMADDEGPWSVGKVLERTRDGRLWGVCEQGSLPLDELPVTAISVVVARCVMPWAISSVLPDDPPSAENVALMRELSRPAVREWLSSGFPPRVPIQMEYEQ